VDAAIAGLIGASLGVVGGLGGAWITQRGQSLRWKIQRQDETYMLLGEWISETWTWAQSLTNLGRVEPDLPAPQHRSHRQVEVAVNLHASKRVDRLVDAYADAFVALDNEYRTYRMSEGHNLAPGESAYDRLRALQERLADAGGAVFEQMSNELRPSLRKII
jgi:hypothetical protein